MFFLMLCRFLFCEVQGPTQMKSHDVGCGVKKRFRVLGW